MTNINAMIQAVLDTGKLGLPKGLDDDVGHWQLGNGGVFADLTDQQAYDLVAMHWARNRPTLDAGRPQGVRFVMALMHGDSEAAIRAMYEALCGGKE